MCSVCSGRVAQTEPAGTLTSGRWRRTIALKPRCRKTAAGGNKKQTFTEEQHQTETLTTSVKVETHAEQRPRAAGVMVTVLTHGLVVEQRHSANKHPHETREQSPCTAQPHKITVRC